MQRYKDPGIHLHHILQEMSTSEFHPFLSFVIVLPNHSMASSSKHPLPLSLVSLLLLVVSALEVTWGDAKALWNLSVVTTALHPAITDV